MIHIGICDDMNEERYMIYSRCEKYFEENEIEHEYTMFSSGEEVLIYCAERENDRIDLLFLDVEMPGISGIELKDAVKQKKKIRSIVFVSNHSKTVFGAFGRKTLGFIPKPPPQEEIDRMLNIIMEEMSENVIIPIRDSRGKKREILLEDIIYLKASGSYTEIMTNSMSGDMGDYILSGRKLGDWEKELENTHIIRVHKSYLVNMDYVTNMRGMAALRNISLEIPLGRRYKEEAKRKYMQYVDSEIRKRLGR